MKAEHFFPALKHAYKRLRSDTHGGVAPMFAIMFLAIMLIIGFTVDFRRIQNAQTHLQNAADSAVLAAARQYMTSGEDDDAKRQANAQKIADDYLNANLLVTSNDFNNAAIKLKWMEDGEIQGDVTSSINLFFGGLLGRKTQNIPAFAAAKVGDSRRLEIVLVLDNSGSMFTSKRMIQLRSAAINFVNSVFDNATRPKSAQIGVVPWNLTVNINMEKPGEWNTATGPAANTTGIGDRSIPPAPSKDMTGYLYPPGYSYSGTYTSSEMEAHFGPVDWRGCIAAAKNERMVNSSGKVTKKLTDEPVGKWPVRLIEPELELQFVSLKKKKKSGTGCEKPSLHAPVGDICSIKDYVKPQDKQCRGKNKSGGGCEVFACDQWHNWFERNTWVPFSVSCSDDDDDVSEGTLDQCVSDPHEFKYLSEKGSAGACSWHKYSSVVPSGDYSTNELGPNADCPTAMLPMSQSRPQIIKKLNHMYPTSNTHADIGLMWGFRMMSSRAEWKNFFGYSSTTQPEAFGSSKVRKMMILLSDGQNTAPWDFEGYYGCNETSRGWVGGCERAEGISKLNTTALNNLMIDACDAILDNDVELYTIALDLNDKKSSEKNAIELLRKCAGDDERFFNIKGNQLDETFKNLAAQALRLSQ